MRSVQPLRSKRLGALEKWVPTAFLECHPLLHYGEKSGFVVGSDSKVLLEYRGDPMLEHVGIATEAFEQTGIDGTGRGGVASDRRRGDRGSVLLGVGEETHHRGARIHARRENALLGIRHRVGSAVLDPDDEVAVFHSLAERIARHRHGLFKTAQLTLEGVQILR